MRKFIFVMAAILAMLPSVSSAQKSTKFPAGMIEIGAIDNKSLAPAVAKIGQLLTVGESRLMFRINSSGGDTDEGIRFIQLVEQIKKSNIKIQCVVDRMAASMAFAILQSICDERYMTKRSFLLVHKPSMLDIDGNVDQVDEWQDLLKIKTNSYVEMCSDRLKISRDAVIGKISRHAWIFGWEEALQVGAIDAVVNPMELPPIL